MLRQLLLLGASFMAFTATDGSHIVFERNNNLYHVTKQQDRDSVVRVEIPEQHDTDAAVVLHDLERKLTVFKDISIGACFLAPLKQTILHSRGLLVRYDANDTTRVQFEYSLFPYGSPIVDLERVAGSKVSELCQEYLTWYATISRKYGMGGAKMAAGTRQRRWSWSSSSAVSIDSDGNIERCFRNDHGDSAATECTAGGAHASSSANATQTEVADDNGENKKSSGGIWGTLKTLLGISK